MEVPADAHVMEKNSLEFLGISLEKSFISNFGQFKKWAPNIHKYVSLNLTAKTETFLLLFLDPPWLVNRLGRQGKFLFPLRTRFQGQITSFFLKSLHLLYIIVETKYT